LVSHGKSWLYHWQQVPLTHFTAFWEDTRHMPTACLLDVLSSENGACPPPTPTQKASSVLTLKAHLQFSSKPLSPLDERLRGLVCTSRFSIQNIKKL
jgi:hypothetical protein